MLIRGLSQKQRAELLWIPPLQYKDAILLLWLEEYGVDDYQQDADNVSTDVEYFVGLEHVGGQDNGFWIIISLATGQADHKNDDNGDDAGVEHLVHEGHFQWQELEKQGNWNGTEYTPDGSFVGGFFPEQTHEEDGEDAGADKSSIFLNVLEHLVDASEERSHEDGNDEGDARTETPDVYQSLLGRLGIEIRLVDVHGKNRGSGIQHGCQRGDDGCCQCREN